MMIVIDFSAPRDTARRQVALSALDALPGVRDVQPRDSLFGGPPVKYRVQLHARDEIDGWQRVRNALEPHGCCEFTAEEDHEPLQTP